jgi:hypothetical protein
MIAPNFLDLMLGTWNEHGASLTVAALTAGQDSEDGAWDESTLDEITTDGYTRGTLPIANLTAASNQSRWNQFGITFGANTSGAATVVTHIAVLNAAGDSVLTLVQLANPVTTASNQQIVVPTAGLKLTAQ